MKNEHNGFNFFNLREIFLQVLLKMNPMWTQIHFFSKMKFRRVAEKRNELEMQRRIIDNHSDIDNDKLISLHVLKPVLSRVYLFIAFSKSNKHIRKAARGD